MRIFFFFQSSHVNSKPFFMQFSLAMDKMKDLSLGETIVRPELFEVEGVAVIKPIASIWDQVWKFKARPDDVLIATYAKAGWCG